MVLGSSLALSAVRLVLCDRPARSYLVSPHTYHTRTAGVATFRYRSPKSSGIVFGPEVEKSQGREDEVELDVSWSPRGFSWRRNNEQNDR